MQLSSRYRWLARRTADLHRLLRVLRRRDVGLLTGLRRFWTLLRHDQFSPDEIFLLNLLDGKAEFDRDAFASKERLAQLQARNNPPEHRDPARDKLAFFLRCSASGLPTPEVLAVSGCATRGTVPFILIRDEADWRRYFEHAAPAACVLKPVTGTHGRGVLPLRRDGAEFVAPDGARYSPAGLLEHMGRSEYAAWQVQRRLWPHRALVELSGTDAMQTLRVVTYTEPRAPARVLSVWLRINGGQTVFDNFNFGAAGNLVAPVDLATGALKHVLQASPDGIGLNTVTHHPVTGVDFSRFVVPGFDDAVRLMRRAADAFKPLVTLGWDVALTDDGASLIEANWTWDPLPMLDSWAPIVRALEGRATPV